MKSLLSVIQSLPAATASLFQVTRPDHRTRRQQLLWLAAIVIVGAVLRFWGLGDVGLHREDEDTSALPVLALLETGTSQFPTGMIYNRALAQTYLMAGSVWLFGNTEWALRLPSVLCGLALIVLGWQMGKRFLEPRWNLAFAAVLAFLPSLVLASQTARMYIFLMASLAGFAILVFRWERTGKVSDYLWSLVVMWIAIQFHTLAVFASLLYFFPPLLHGDARRLWLAVAGVVMSVFAYDTVNDWLGQHFPQSTVQGFAVRPPVAGPMASGLAPGLPLVWLLAGAVLALVPAVFLALRVKDAWPRAVTGLLAIASLVALLLPAFHLSALLMLATAVVALRFGERVWPGLIAVAIAAVVIAVAQVLRLQEAGVDSLRNIIGLLVGRPSLFVYPRFAQYSWAAALLCLPLTLAALWRIAQKQSVPDVLLWLVLGGWLPLLAVGAFEWNPAPRYTIVTLLPMLLAATAALQWATQRWQRGMPAVLGIAVLLLVNPVVFARTWNAGYSLHPDHVGAAQFVLSQHPGPRDIIVAEDAIVQKYYLPRIDYWLMARESIIDFVRNYDGVFRDIYTGSRIIGNDADLQAVLDQPDRGAIYIIGSGENQEDGRRYMRGAQLHARLSSSEFPVVFTGRDGLTKVWRIPPPAR